MATELVASYISQNFTLEEKFCDFPHSLFCKITICKEKNDYWIPQVDTVFSLMER